VSADAAVKEPSKIAAAKDNFCIVFIFVLMDQIMYARYSNLSIYANIAILMPTRNLSSM
jgi:hypothetical protein